MMVMGMGRDLSKDDKNLVRNVVVDSLQTGGSMDDANLRFKFNISTNATIVKQHHYHYHYHAIRHMHFVSLLDVGDS